MYVFVDESGDAGFRFGEGSTPYLTFAAVVFDDLEAADACEELIRQARTANGLGRNVPLHYYKDHPRTRQSVIASVETATFRIMSVTIDKRSLDPRRISAGHSGAYLQLAEFALARFAPELRNSTVVVDGVGSRRFRRTLVGRLRNAANRASSGSVRRVRLYGADQYPLLQLADYCAVIAQRMVLGDREAEGFHRRFGEKWRRRWLVESLE